MTVLRILAMVDTLFSKIALSPVQTLSCQIKISSGETSIVGLEQFSLMSQAMRFGILRSSKSLSPIWRSASLVSSQFSSRLVWKCDLRLNIGLDQSNRLILLQRDFHQNVPGEAFLLHIISFNLTMHQYQLISKIGEGTFSEVFKARQIHTGQLVAIKCMKNNFESLEHVKNLPEIQALLQLSQHQNIVRLIEVLFDEPTHKLALVCELMEMNLFDSIRNRNSYISMQKVRKYISSVLKAINYMHKRNLFHRDIKPENILLKNNHVKLADLGSCKSARLQHPYTEYISTRWYRAPECLMTDGYYDAKMDIWGVGCVMFEIIALFPLFQGENELDQIHKIFKVLGTPDSDLLQRFKSHATHMEFNFRSQKGIGIERLLPPHAGPDCIDLLHKLLTMDPNKRITAEEALRHEFFDDVPGSISPPRPPPIPVQPQPAQPQKPNVKAPKPGPAQKPNPKAVYPGMISVNIRIGPNCNQSDEDDKVLFETIKLPPIVPVVKPSHNPKVPYPYKKKKPYEDQYVLHGKKAQLM